MEDLVEQYLFTRGNCPLPSVGTLYLKGGNAIVWHGDNKLAAPVPYIEFSREEKSAEDFIAFIAAQRNIPLGSASVSLQKYCIGVQKLQANAEIKLENAGKFYIDQSGELLFKEYALPKEFLPSVRFERVLHTKAASHSIRVGDTETTSEVMTEYYSDKEIVKKDRWWIAAAILTVVAAAVLVFYFIDHKPAGNFGNEKPVNTVPQHRTYTTN